MRPSERAMAAAGKAYIITVKVNKLGEDKWERVYFVIYRFGAPHYIQSLGVKGVRRHTWRIGEKQGTIVKRLLDVADKVWKAHPEKSMDVEVQWSLK